MDQECPCVLRFALRDNDRTRLFVAAAGGTELPSSAEAFRLRVALPMALGKAFGVAPARAARISCAAECFEEEAEGLRWIRWSGRVPEGARDMSSEELAAALSAGAGVPVFEDFMIDGVAPDGAWARAESASVSRDTGELLRLYAALEAKALGAIAAQAPPASSAPRL